MSLRVVGGDQSTMYFEITIRFIRFGKGALDSR